MEVSNVSADVPTAPAGTAPASEQGAPLTGPGQGTPLPTPAALPADFADIRPLDISGALQILVAEVRAGLDSLLDASVARSAPTAGTPISSAPTAGTPISGAPTALVPFLAVRELVELLLQAIPDDAGDAPAWTAVLVRVEDTIQSSIDRAIGVVTQWRDVPAASVDAARETRALFSTLLEEEVENPFWLRAEWIGFAPVLLRFRRRRRNARRRLIDPDHSPRSLDESEEFRG